MMTSSLPHYEQAFVWIWLPGARAPVVAGRLQARDGLITFTYGRSYRERRDAIPLYLPELPLRAGELPPPAGLTLAGCIRDGAPDAWGRRVIVNRLFGAKVDDVAERDLWELAYLLESGSDRIGALDFQSSASLHTPRQAASATLDELLQSAERVEKGLALSVELDQALHHGSSIGGARPKALLEDGDTKRIAKFSSSSDLYSLVKSEYVAMRLAALCGITAASVSLTHAAGKDVLLIERFDRVRAEDGWQRKAMVSALTILGLDEMMARYASYQDLAETIRHRFTAPGATLRELFARIVFNILCGNTDDHARNHAAFWDGGTLELTPAYDICPQGRTGGEATQAMLILGNRRFSQLSLCLEAAPVFHLDAARARAIIAGQQAAIEAHWDAVCDEAALGGAERAFLWRRQFLNPFAFEGFAAAPN